MESILMWIGENKFYVLLGLGLLFNCFWVMQFANKLEISTWKSCLIVVINTICSVLAAKIFAFLENGEGGMSLFGGVFFLPAVYYLEARLIKQKASAVFDVLTICTIVTVTCARFNCVFTGCCLGKVIPGTDGFRWPTREIELIFYFILIVWLSRRLGKGKFTGQLYPLYMISYGIFRFIEEWFRETERTYGLFHLAHLWAVVSVAVGAAFYFYLKKNPASADTQRKKNQKPGSKKSGK